MKSEFFSYLDGFNLITIIAPNEFNSYDKKFNLISENETIPLTILNVESLGMEMKYTTEVNETIALNESYYVSDEERRLSFLRIGKVVRTELFDMMYEYDKHDLGVTYTKEKTTFKLWSPVAKEIELELVLTNGMRQYIDLTYYTNGLWQTEVFQDLEGAKYRYRVRVNEWFKTITDPYAISSTANGEYAYVVNPDKFKKFKNPVPEFSGKRVDAVIYEASIRDLTSSSTSKTVNKGKFIGLLENHKDEGIDYISKLGVTHLQLLPIFDFEGVDELDEFASYNWGYNPSQYNVVEGSYSTNPNDPYKRINELIELIDYIHKKGMRVSMDVVYNHVFNMKTFPFESLVPGYFFRFDKYGIKTEASGCQNDTASERLMMHHFILQSIKHWMKTFRISAFRFDLMGLHDIELMTKVNIVSESIDPHAMIYGEGWVMDSTVAKELRSNMNNSQFMPNVSFFNDTFRDAIKGGTFSKTIGYALGGKVKKNDLYYLFTGSSIDRYKFSNPSQSVNYVECHDNHTFYDRAKILNKSLKEEEIKDYAGLALAFVILSQGIPFIHAGQSFLRSKQGVENSYKSSDEINKIDWDLKDKHQDLVNTTRDLIKLRKQYRVFRLDSNAKIKKQIRIQTTSPEKNTINFQLTDLNKTLCVYFKNDYEHELLTPGLNYELIFNKDHITKDKVNELVVNKPGCYIFIKED